MAMVWTGSVMWCGSSDGLLHVYDPQKESVGKITCSILICQIVQTLKLTDKPRKISPVCYDPVNGRVWAAVGDLNQIFVYGLLMKIFISYFHRQAICTAKKDRDNRKKYLSHGSDW